MRDNNKRCCENCLYVASHEGCGEIGSEGYCLNNKDIDGYTYSNFVKGDGIARIRELEDRGERNIVISGTGEAEVNVLNSPERTYKNLCHVSEQCGYYTYKGEWTEHVKVINICLEDRLFGLVYINGKLDRMTYGEEMRTIRMISISKEAEVMKDE